MALAEFVLSVAHDGLKVHIVGDFPPERAVQKVVLGRGREILHPADNVVEFHQVVVDYVREVVRRHTVGLYENIVLEFLILHGYVAENHIVIGRRAFLGDILADNVRLACGYAALDLFLG